jgi:histone acetyltransferase (RNA polymerase elongator complex component)
MSTLAYMNLDTIELSFFGGSFTAIPMEEQQAFLKIAKEYKDKGIIQKIHLSTRPDCINEQILDNLKNYHVDVIELGVQSFSDQVLMASKRGHLSACVYKSCQLIKDYGFSLGIQLMAGLPKDTYEYDVYSAKETVKLKPDIARIYPTVVIEDTELFDMFKSDEYIPMTEDDAVKRCAAMYRILTGAGINVIRVGLKASDIITNDVTSGTFHPAFRQLVEGKIAREDLENQLLDLGSANKVSFVSNSQSFNNMVGHKGINKEYFRLKYPNLRIKYEADDNVEKGLYLLKVKE